MRKIFKSLFSNPELKKLKICPNHKKSQSKENIQTQVLPYSTDHCLTCAEYICHSCSESHVSQHCRVECKRFINQVGIVQDPGLGIQKAFNFGSVMKVELDQVKCICGKSLGSGAAMCAACGLASCSQECHREWQSLGNCVFNRNFYSVPEGSTMRSILFNNIYKIRESNISEWAIANRSSTTMICCYASSKQSHVFLQRGYRNYGRPQDELLNLMQEMPKTIDYQIHYDRRCDCDCQICENRPIHSSNNCQATCFNFALEYMKRAFMEASNHKQCSCTCQFCRSGVIIKTHRIIDCLPFCERGAYKLEFGDDDSIFR